MMQESRIKVGLTMGGGLEDINSYCRDFRSRCFRLGHTHPKSLIEDIGGDRELAKQGLCSRSHCRCYPCI